MRITLSANVYLGFTESHVNPPIPALIWPAITTAAAAVLTKAVRPAANACFLSTPALTAAQWPANRATHRPNVSMVEPAHCPVASANTLTKETSARQGTIAKTTTVSMVTAQRLQMVPGAHVMMASLSISTRASAQHNICAMTAARFA